MTLWLKSNCPDLHKHKFYCNPKIRDFQRLDARRVARLGLEERFARTYDVMRYDPPPPIISEGCGKCRSPLMPWCWNNYHEIRNKFSHANVLAPFWSVQKRVNGIYFCFERDNRLKKFWMPAAGHRMPKWRPIVDYDQYS